MKLGLILLILVILIAVGIIYTSFRNQVPNFPSATSQPKTDSYTQQDTSQITVIAENLDTPWAITFLPDQSILVTERAGRVRIIDSTGNFRPTPIVELTQVKEIGEGGLLGITTHPDFSKNHYVYLYYTYAGNGNNTLNRVVRMTYEDQKLINEEVIVDNIPGAANHNGGRIKFGPDGLLYISTGDAQEPSLAQNTESLAGKILRVNDQGKAPLENPFNNLVYTYGHRNVQGLTWNSNQDLWATEHGRSGVLSGLDELNLIEKGKNYGWPVIQGNEVREGMVTPKQNSGNTTWAPAGAAFLGDKLFFGGLRGQALYEATIQGDIVEIREHFKDQFGRIREVIVGPDHMIYITTSNKDGRGNPGPGDDKVIRINPDKIGTK